MKDFWAALKWMAGQSRKFIPALISIAAMGAVSSLCSVGLAITSKTLIDAATSADKKKALIFAVVFAGIILAEVGLNAAISMLSVRTLEVMSNDMRKKLFTRLAQTGWMDFTRYHSDDILTRMTSDVEIVAGGLVHVLPDIISFGVLLAAAFLTLMFYDPMLSVLAFILGPLSLLFSRFFGRKLKNLHLKTQQAESSYRAYIHEAIQNMLIVKVFNLAERKIRNIDQLQRNRLGWVLRRNGMNIAANSVLSLGYWAGYLLAFVWGAMQLSVGAATFGTMTAFLQLVEHVQSPMIGLAYTYPQIISAAASTGRLMEFDTLQLEDELIKAPNLVHAGIRFQDVCFSYDQEKELLTGVTFEIKPGEIVALTGPSGKGKTTLVRLLLLLVKPLSGHICFTDDNGTDYEANVSGRTLISLVPQGNTLFSGTIAENLRAGDPAATDDELTQAARTACAWEFIEALPDRLNTVIGEQGLGLSEGQIQRLAIARALLRKTPILILDEATSAIDIAAETVILESIRALDPPRTCLIITHRDTAFNICDRVFQLENGKITSSFSSSCNNILI